jgi:DNA-binding NtrC family response regulator
VRELEHVVTQAAMLEDGAVLEGVHFTPVSLSPVVSDLLPRRPFEKLDASAKRKLAEQALVEAGNNKSRAASALGLTRKTLYAWLSGSG